jgi:high-affinity Fe2+/Pb2+ permease
VLAQQYAGLFSKTSEPQIARCLDAKMRAKYFSLVPQIAVIIFGQKKKLNYICLDF